MAETLKKLGQMVLTGSGTIDTVYTVPVATSAIVKHIRVVNFSPANVTLQVWHDGTADENIILPAIPIDAGGYCECDDVLTLEEGDTIRMEAGSATSLTATVYGVEFS